MSGDQFDPPPAPAPASSMMPLESPSAPAPSSPDIGRDVPPATGKRKRPSRAGGNKRAKTAKMTTSEPLSSSVAPIIPVEAPAPASVQVQTDPMDKKRNKLGYHRTSVACSHCRRRKIRCLIPNDDPSGRCANCIRLKRECHFYPVDQTNPHGKKVSKAQPASQKRQTASSAPELSHSSTYPGEGDDFSGFQGLSTAPTQTFPLPHDHHGGLGVYPPSSEQPRPAPLDYPHSFDLSNEWEHSAYSQAPPTSLATEHSSLDFTSTPHWRPPDSSHFSHFEQPSTSYQHMHIFQSPDIIGPQDHRFSAQANNLSSQDFHWASALPRSFSYAGPEYPSPHGTPQQPDHSTRRATTLPNLSASSTSENSHAPAPADVSAIPSLAHAYGPPFSHPGYPQSWSWINDHHNTPEHTKQEPEAKEYEAHAYERAWY